MKSVEGPLEAAIFSSRWVLAPFYIGLVLSMALLLYAFAKEFIGFLPEIPTAKSGVIIITVLSLVDIVMVANLVLVIVFAGYETFVSKIHSAANHEDRPDWMGLVSFSDLKIKLMGTIVAISGIDLLKTFLNVGAYQRDEIMWRVLLHLTFVLSGVLFALMDRLAAHKTANGKTAVPAGRHIEWDSQPEPQPKLRRVNSPEFVAPVPPDPHGPR
jgi:uncharacterized protein (TIGR00645 family)